MSIETDIKASMNVSIDTERGYDIIMGTGKVASTETRTGRGTGISTWIGMENCD